MPGAHEPGTGPAFARPMETAAAVIQSWVTPADPGQLEDILGQAQAAGEPA